MPEGRRPLSDLEQTADFQRRHIGPGEAEIAAMLDTLDLSSLDDLIERTVPASIRDEGPALAGGRTEAQALADVRALALRNTVFKSMIGMGYHDCYTPPVILRNVLENPGWYTAYTPYQPEISQGRFEALLNFQQMVIDLIGLDIANASLLDEGTAAAEAMTLMKRVGKNENDTLFVAADCHPRPSPSSRPGPARSASGSRWARRTATSTPPRCSAFSFSIRPPTARWPTTRRSPSAFMTPAPWLPWPPILSPWCC